MALTTARSTPRKMDAFYNSSIAVPAAASQTFYSGALVCLNASGLLVPGATSTTLTPVGVLMEQPNIIPARVYTPATNEQMVVQLGTFKFNNDGTNPVLQAHLLELVYIVDDETVSILSTGRSYAGVCVGIDDATSPTGAGVWVAVGASPPIPV